MKKKTIIQQPFKKPEARKQITIKIKSPSSFQSAQTESQYYRKEREPLAATKELLNQIYARVKHSQEVIQLSKKQALSPKKLISSDYMTLNFKYQSPKNGFEKAPLFRLDQRESQYSESQGSIQLPLHFETSREQDTFATVNSAQESVDRKNHEKMYFSERNHYGNGIYQQEDRKFYLNNITNSLEKKQFNTIQSPLKQHMRKKTEEIQWLNHSIKSNSHQKDHKMSKALHKKTISHHQRGLERDKLKYYQNGILDKHYLPSQSIGQQLKIKINRPSKVKLLKTTNAFCKKEKISIKMPSVSPFDSNKSGNKSTLQGLNEWQIFKQQLQKYQFIKKYLIESDLFEIYTFLLKNNIQRDKWPLFAVDQAYKRMNLHKY